MLPTMPPAIRSSKLANLAPDMLSLFPELARAPLVLSLSGLFCLWLWLGCCAVRQPHSEYRTLARFACHRHVATHHAREFAGDGEPEPSPPKALSGRGIGLRELLEQLGLLYPCAGDGDSGADVVANSRREGHSAATAAIDHRHDCDCTSPFTDGPPIDAVVIPFFLRAAVGGNWRLTSPVGARRRNASHVILLRTAAFATRLNAKSVGRFRN
jgi:hypothetical protein